MELNFLKVGNEWVSAVKVEGDFNLHLERKGTGSLVVSQRGASSGEYGTAFVIGVFGSKVVDYDFGALVYPKWIKITSGSEVLNGVVTSNEEVTKVNLSKHEFVDLGLSVNWATCNLGATKPEETGLYYAWGETEGYTAEDVAAGKKAFTDSDYKYYVEPTVMSKYNKTDGLTVLEDSDDAAYISDGFCRMPSKEDLEELVANTTAKLETLGGVKGWRLTSTKNSNSIFIPYTGQYMDGQSYGMDNFGLLWSNTNAQSMMNVNVFALSVIEDGVSVVEFMRYAGIPIRPVQDK